MLAISIAILKIKFVSCFIQSNTAAAGEKIGVVVDAAHHNVKDNICKDNHPKCTGM